MTGWVLNNKSNVNFELYRVGIFNGQQSAQKSASIL